MFRRNDTAAAVGVRLGYSGECGAGVADAVPGAPRVSTEAVVGLDGPTVDPDPVC